jgi:hypothetical protein
LGQELSANAKIDMDKDKEKIEKVIIVHASDRGAPCLNGPHIANTARWISWLKSTAVQCMTLIWLLQAYVTGAMEQKQVLILANYLLQNFPFIRFAESHAQALSELIRGWLLDRFRPASSGSSNSMFSASIAR